MHFTSSTVQGRHSAAIMIAIDILLFAVKHASAVVHLSRAIFNLRYAE